MDMKGIENLDKSIITIFEQIKTDIFQTREKVLADANKELLYMYFRIGKLIAENSKYGNNFINELSKKLKLEFPENNGYSPRNLARMRKFYETYKDFSILPPAVAKLPWTHNFILIEKIKDFDKRMWYAQKCIENGWSKIVLEHQIDLQLYERQADSSKKLTNFENSLPAPQSELSRDIIKDPYIFELVGLKEKIVEKDIETAMLEQIKTVLLELGKGFSFIGNQYRISTPSNDYLIDLLFYHLELRCYVVVELKNVDFKPDFIGQLQFYITAVDETLKKDVDNPTIGLLLCKGKDRYSVEWSLKATTAPIGVASYEIRNYLPTEEELNKYLK